jgi:hypothetical protein
MSNLGKKTLALLSLLVIFGILSIQFFYNTPMVLISYLMCGIGGYAFGTLLAKK